MATEPWDASPTSMRFTGMTLTDTFALPTASAPPCKASPWRRRPWHCPRRPLKRSARAKERVLNMLHPPGSAQVAAPAALDAEMTDTVKTVAERSGMDAEAIAAMFSLDVAAVRAVLTPQLEPQMADTVKTIAKQSGMDAAAIAAMLSLDVDAVGAAGGVTSFCCVARRASLSTRGYQTLPMTCECEERRPPGGGGVGVMWGRE